MGLIKRPKSQIDAGYQEHKVRIRNNKTQKIVDRFRTNNNSENTNFKKFKEDL